MLEPLIAFLVAVGILVFFHELGHYAAARWAGVRVERFSVGFGRAVFAWRDRQGTEWVVGWLPLGGFVKMAEGGKEGGEDAPFFDRQHPAVKMIIVAAGPAANFIAAFAFYTGVAWLGVEEPAAQVMAPAESPAAAAGIATGDTVVAVGGERVDSWTQLRTRVLSALAGGASSVEVRVMRAGEAFTTLLPLSNVTLDPERGEPMQQLGLMPWRPPQPAVVGRVMAGSPAARVGLQPGDRIVRVGEEEITTWEGLAEFVRSHPGAEVRLVWERQGGMQEGMVTIERVRERDGREVGRLGVQGVEHTPTTVRVRYGFWDGLIRAAERTAETTLLTIRLLVKMVEGEASIKNLAGPLTIADAAGRSAKLGAAPFLDFLALVSVSLAVLNLLPIPILDGGHLLYHLAEWVRGQPLPPWVEAWGLRVGIALLALLMGVALINDLMRWMG
ncbi:MAG: RIP metalloprotease RseP [Hydrogenophilus sp.]|nr:RIP metalloprotease RseP [Hydrogenophilus sp.]